jgi:hypothetical protein
MPAATPLNVAGLGKPAIGAAEQDRQRILPAGSAGWRLDSRNALVDKPNHVELQFRPITTT